MIYEDLVYDCHCGWAGFGSDLVQQADYDWNGTSYVDCSSYHCPVCSSDSVSEQDYRLDDEANEYSEIWCSRCNHTGKVYVWSEEQGNYTRDVCRSCHGLTRIRVYTGYYIDADGNRHSVEYQSCIMCEGTGKIDHDTCIACSGEGKLIKTREIDSNQ